jgi:hypothetical protein
MSGIGYRGAESNLPADIEARLANIQSTISGLEAKIIATNNELFIYNHIIAIFIDIHHIPSKKHYSIDNQEYALLTSTLAKPAQIPYCVSYCSDFDDAVQ